jgi:hypothetical protein
MLPILPALPILLPELLPEVWLGLLPILETVAAVGAWVSPFQGCAE